MPTLGSQEVPRNLEGGGVQASNRFFADINRFLLAEVSDIAALGAGGLFFAISHEALKNANNENLLMVLIPIVVVAVEAALHKKLLKEDLNIVSSTKRLLVNAAAIAVVVGAFSLFASIGESNAKAQALLPTNTASPTYTPPPTFTPTATFAPTETATPMPTATNTPHPLDALYSATTIPQNLAAPVRQVVEPIFEEQQKQAFAAGKAQGENEGLVKGGLIGAVTSALAGLGIYLNRRK